MKSHLLLSTAAICFAASGTAFASDLSAVSINSGTFTFSQSIKITNTTDNDTSMNIGVYYNVGSSTAYVSNKDISANSDETFSLGSLRAYDDGSSGVKFSFLNGASSSISSSNDGGSCTIIATYETSDSSISSRSYEIDSCDSNFSLDSSSGSTLKIELSSD